MDTKATLKQYIIKQFMYETEDQNLDDDTPLVANGIIDSMGLVRLVEYTEKIFRIKIEEDEVEIENFYSLKNLTEFINSKIS